MITCLLVNVCMASAATPWSGVEMPAHVATASDSMPKIRLAKDASEYERMGAELDLNAPRDEIRAQLKAIKHRSGDSKLSRPPVGAFHLNGATKAMAATKKNPRNWLLPAGADAEQARKSFLICVSAILGLDGHYADISKENEHVKYDAETNAFVGYKSSLKIDDALAAFEAFLNAVDSEKEEERVKEEISKLVVNLAYGRGLEVYEKLDLDLKGETIALIVTQITRLTPNTRDSSLYRPKITSAHMRNGIEMMKAVEADPDAWFNPANKELLQSFIVDISTILGLTQGMSDETTTLERYLAGYQNVREENPDLRYDASKGESGAFVSSDGVELDISKARQAFTKFLNSLERYKQSREKS